MSDVFVTATGLIVGLVFCAVVAGMFAMFGYAVTRVVMHMIWKSLPPAQATVFYTKNERWLR